MWMQVKTGRTSYNGWGRLITNVGNRLAGFGRFPKGWGRSHQADFVHFGPFSVKKQS
jgi:hypothetical protein